MAVGWGVGEGASRHIARELHPTCVGDCTAHQQPDDWAAACTARRSMRVSKHRSMLTMHLVHPPCAHFMLYMMCACMVCPPLPARSRMILLCGVCCGVLWCGVCACSASARQWTPCMRPAPCPPTTRCVGAGWAGYCRAPLSGTSSRVGQNV